MPTDFFDQYAPSNGNTGVSGYGNAGDGYDVGGGPPPEDGGGGGDDPFGYTGGSLLTPWSGHFDGSRFGGGGAVAKYTPFQYQDFNYNFRQPDAFSERYDDPGQFKYADYEQPDQFKGVSQEDLEADPSYQFRQQAGQKALMASKAAKGILNTGGTAKGLMKYGQEYASQEYGNVYQRKAGEHDRAVAEGVQGYNLRRGNAAENFDRNTNNARQAHQIRQGDWQANADTSLRGQQEGYDIAGGTYDRNYSNARTRWQDDATHQQQLASAANSASSQAYGRALDEYQMSRDEFWTNQDRQWGRLSDVADRGQHAADNTSAYASDYGQRTDNAITGGANARAAGYVGRANAYSGAANDIGDAAFDAGLAYGTAPRGRGGNIRNNGMPGTPTPVYVPGRPGRR